MKYKKKPVIIDAIIWEGNNIHEVKSFAGDYCEIHKNVEQNTFEVILKTLESNDKLNTRHHASVGDYIIKGVQGEFYACKPDIFLQTYEQV